MRELTLTESEDVSYKIAWLEQVSLLICNLLLIIDSLYQRVVMTLGSNECFMPMISSS